MSISVLIAVLLTSFHCHSSEVEVIEVSPHLDYWGWNLRPANKSDFDAELLRKSSIHHFEEFLATVANVNAAGGSNRQRFFQIRGIGERSQYEGVPNHSVGVFIDNIDVSGVVGILSSDDIQTIEVLRGPQSVYYGSGALAGLIELSSIDGELMDRWSMGIGNLNRKKFSALHSRENYHLSFETLDEDGHMSNAFTGNKRTAKNTESQLKGHYKIRAGALRIKNNWILASSDNGYDHWALDGGYQTLSDRAGIDTQKTLGTSLEIKSRLNSHLLQRNIFSHTFSKMQYNYDEDWGNDAYWKPLNSGSGYDYNTENSRTRRVSHVKSQLEGERWVAGLHGYSLGETNQINSYKDGSLRKSPLHSNFSSTSLAAFGSYFYELGQHYRIRSSARVEWQKLKFDSGVLNVDPGNRDWAASFEVAKIWSPNIQSVFLISRGYKTAGFNTNKNITEKFRFYKPEQMLNYEITTLYRRPDFELSINIFEMRLKDQQIKSSYQDDPTDPSSFTEIIDNAASSYSRGVETRLESYVNSNIETDLSIGLLQAGFDSYSFQGAKFDGRQLAHAPAYGYSIGMKYKISEKYSLRPEIVGKDSFYFSNSHGQKSSAYQVLNLNLAYQTKRWRVQSWAKNLTSEKYETRGFYFANEPPDWKKKRYVQLGPPLRLGVDVTYDW